MSNLTHQLIETNGVNLHVVQSGSPDGQLVLLLHGFPEFWYGWRRQIDALAAQGYWVWAPDQRGYNLSEKPAGITAYTIDKLAADVSGLIDAAGREQAFVVGHDWGGGVAWATALGYPEKIAKLVILNAPHPLIMRDALRANPAQMLKSWYIGMFQLPLLPEAMLLLGDGLIGAQGLLRTSRPGTFTDDDLAAYTRAWKQPGAAEAMVNWYRAVIQQQPPLLDDMRVHMPTLVIWGAQDQFLGREMVQPSLDLCDSGRAVFIEQASHWVQHEEAERVNTLLLEFFGAAAL